MIDWYLIDTHHFDFFSEILENLKLHVFWWSCPNPILCNSSCTNLSYTSFFIPQKTCISKRYCIQINNITTFFVKTKNAPPKQISYNCAGAGAIDISNPASVDRCHKMVSEQSTALCTMALILFISVQKLWGDFAF